MSTTAAESRAAYSTQWSSFSLWGWQSPQRHKCTHFPCSSFCLRARLLAPLILLHWTQSPFLPTLSGSSKMRPIRAT
eukprot:1141624-Pyramimonas_sp.AAC.1